MADTRVVSHRPDKPKPATAQDTIVPQTHGASPVRSGAQSGAVAGFPRSQLGAAAHFPKRYIHQSPSPQVDQGMAWMEAWAAASKRRLFASQAKLQAPARGHAHVEWAPGAMHPYPPLLGIDRRRGHDAPPAGRIGRVSPATIESVRIWHKHRPAAYPPHRSRSGPVACMACLTAYGGWFPAYRRRAGCGHVALRNLPFLAMTLPSTSMRPLLRRSHTMSQCKALLFLPPDSG